MSTPQRNVAVIRKPKPAAVTTPSASSEGNGGDSVVLQDAKRPWSPVTSLAGKAGLCMGLFGMGGSGKTSLVATASPKYKLLQVAIDRDIESIRDRDDIMSWPGEDFKGDWSFRRVADFASNLARRQHPFDIVNFDTMNALYELALAEVDKTWSGKDQRQRFGQANDMVIGLISQWTDISRSTGLNVIFTCHAEEKQDGENGPLLMRMSITPGVVKMLYQKCNTIGALQVIAGKHKLLLHNTSRIIAKVHQPKSGPQLPLEIYDADLGLIIQHMKGGAPYPVEKKAAK